MIGFSGVFVMMCFFSESQITRIFRRQKQIDFFPEMYYIFSNAAQEGDISWEKKPYLLRKNLRNLMLL